jgi:integrase/recombinase XerC
MSIIDDQLRACQTRLIDAWITDLRVTGKAQATIETYEPPVRRAHRELPYGLAGSTTDELKAWIWAPGLAPASRKLYRSAIAAFLGWAYAGGHSDCDPAVLLPKVRVPETEPRPTEQTILADILARSRDPYRRWILIAAAMGLRSVEIARLDREHVTAERTWVQGKGGKNVYVPTHPAVWDELRPLPPGPVARRIDGGRATRRDVYTRANGHIRRLGYKGVTMHRMRAWHATHIFRSSGRDIIVAKTAMRHTNLATTQRYVAGEEGTHVVALHALPLPI